MTERELAEVIAERLPYDGPHSADTVKDAAESISALVRYLNNATGPGNGKQTLAWANTTESIVGCLKDAMYGMDQLLTQLSGAMERQASNPGLYDDRRDRPASDTAYAAADDLGEARQAAFAMAEALAAAQSSAAHLGNDDTND